MSAESKKNFKKQKVLVMGLGLLGGGIATTKWFVKHGAKVTVTDLKTKKELAVSIKSLGATAKKIKFVLGRHREKDFRENKIIVVNPAVPRESKFLKIARKNGAQIENEASIFFRFCENTIIAVTGTRGKTTSVNWIHHFLKTKYPRAVLTGNSSENPMLKALDFLDGKSPVVVELSSWHLEILPKAKKSPHIAVITNIYPDHLNRYRGLKDYASAKANIFKYQTKNDFLILNKSNKWTEFFLLRKPKSKILYFPAKFNLNKKTFIQKYGSHNFENLSAAVWAAELAGVPRLKIKKSINSLPQVKFREEIIFENRRFKVINDSTATSPDATIAALKRFNLRKNEIILIAGGTDKNLEFSAWARLVKKYIKPGNLFLLNGSATKKMVFALQESNFFRNSKPKLFEDLPTLLKQVKIQLPFVNLILFSPGAASFEKFKNEFDRGEKFNLYFKAVVLQQKGDEL